MDQLQTKSKQKWTAKRIGLIAAPSIIVAVIALAIVTRQGAKEAGPAKAPPACRCVVPEKPEVGKPLCTYLIARCGCPYSLPGKETTCQMFPESELCHPKAGQECAQTAVQDQFVKTCANKVTECRRDEDCQSETQTEERKCTAGAIVQSVDVYDSCEDGEQKLCRGACMLTVKAGDEVHYFKGKCAL